MSKHKWWEGMWEIELRDKNGRTIEKEITQNALVDQGEQLLLDSFFRGQNTPTGFYIRLCNDTLDEADTLSTLRGEPTDNGYSAQGLQRSVSGFPILELDDSDYTITSTNIQFSASGGDISQVNTAFLATSSGGRIDCNPSLVASSIDTSRSEANRSFLTFILICCLNMFCSSCCGSGGVKWCWLKLVVRWLASLGASVLSFKHIR